MLVGAFVGLEVRDKLKNLIPNHNENSRQTNRQDWYRQGTPLFSGCFADELRKHDK